MSLHDRLTIENLNRQQAIPALARECRALLEALVAQAEQELRHGI